MLEYYKQEKLLNTLPETGSEMMSGFWKVDYLDKFARDESIVNKKELLRTARLQISTGDVDFADIYRYILAKRNLR